MKTMKMLGVTWLLVLLGWFNGAESALAGPIIYNVPGALGTDYPELWMVNADGTGNHRVPVSPELVFGADLPTWSRDGKLIAATGVIGGTTLTGYVGQYQTDTTTVTVLDQNEVLPAGKVLYVFNPATAQVLVPIAGPVGPNAPTTYYETYKAFSPDGKQVAYANLQGNYVEFGIVTLNGQPLAASRGVTLLTNPTVIPLGEQILADYGAWSGTGIDWSPLPGGDLVVPLSETDECLDPASFGIYVPVNVTKLFLVPPVAGGLDKRIPLTHTPCGGMSGLLFYDFFPTFSPDGNQIAFVRFVVDQGGLLATPTWSSIWVIQADGTKPEHIVAGWWQGAFVGPVSWAPDGSQLVFSAAQVSSSGIPGAALGLFRINRDGSGLARFEGAPAENASWSRAFP